MGLLIQDRFDPKAHAVIYPGDCLALLAQIPSDIFHLDRVRVPQKYPNKRHFKGPKKGELSGNPLGKNPGDVWIFPNVKANHVEKTTHPAQYPVELVERFVLALTEEGDWVLDPFGAPVPP
jgi:DNA modification methylase